MDQIAVCQLNLTGQKVSCDLEHPIRNLYFTVEQQSGQILTNVHWSHWSFVTRYFPEISLQQRKQFPTLFLAGSLTVKSVKCGYLDTSSQAFRFINRSKTVRFKRSDPSWTQDYLLILPIRVGRTYCVSFLCAML